MRKIFRTISWQFVAAWGTMLLLWVVFALVAVRYANADSLTLTVSGATGGVPAGGSTGQALIKNSNSDYDTKWGSVSSVGAESQAAFDTYSTNTAITISGKQASLGYTPVPNTTMVNGHALSANVTVSASDLTTGTLPHAQLPTLLSGDIPANAANTSGSSGSCTGNAATATTAANLSGTPALPNGTMATTQTTGDNSNKLATDTFVLANAGSRDSITTDTYGSTITFDRATASIHTVTLTGNPTLVVSNMSTTAPLMVIHLVQDSTGSRTVTWWSGIKWPGGTAPTLTTTANKADSFIFEYISSGNYYGYIAGQNQ